MESLKQKQDDREREIKEKGEKQQKRENETQRKDEEKDKKLKENRRMKKKEQMDNRSTQESADMVKKKSHKPMIRRVNAFCLKKQNIQEQAK